MGRDYSPPIGTTNKKTINYEILKKKFNIR